LKTPLLFDIRNQFAVSVEPVMIDSHAHLDFPDFDADLDEVIDRAAKAGITHIIVPGVRPESWRKVLQLADRYENIYAALGIHPNYSNRADDKAWRELQALLKQPKIVGIGETGLDYYRDASPRKTQVEVFKRQLEMARAMRLPLILHCRDAFDECLKILRETASEELSGVAHCFGGDAAFASELIAMGFNISFAGQVTFKNADALRRVVKDVPVFNLLLETDSPFLAPEPHRGKRNEPAFLAHIVPKLAELHDLSNEDIERITNVNCYRLFGVGNRPPRGKIAYTVKNKCYLNITNRCTNRCVFCIRQGDGYFLGHHLRLESEPTAVQVIQAMGDPTRFDEVVFSGLGEPTIKLNILKTIARQLKARGVRVRLNTNGQGSLFHGRDICPELVGLVDTVWVAVQTADPREYLRLCRPEDGDRAFPAVIDFIKRAKQLIGNVEITALNMPGVDVAGCERLARELGVGFRLRRYREPK